jgi:murein DD-endopeptidase MepM/ murein hydrolase activator NlpD
MIWSVFSFFKAEANLPYQITVKVGETLDKIAEKYQVNKRSIINYNHLKKPYNLRPGQQLRFPPIHIVRHNDNIYTISRRYQISVEQLAKTNGIHQPYHLKIGQRLDLSREEAMYAAPAIKAKPRKKVPIRKRIPRARQAPRQTQRQEFIKIAPKPVLGPNAYDIHPVSKPAKSLKYERRGKSIQFCWPAKGEIIFNYGRQLKGQVKKINDGINIAGKRGDAVYAACDGVVAYAGSEVPGYGGLILIKHGDGWMTTYGHNESLLVKKGDRVKYKQKIALMGSSGNVLRPQLHFEIRKNTKAINPKKYLKK